MLWFKTKASRTAFINENENLFREAVANSLCLADVCRYMGLATTAGNRRIIRAAIDKYFLDTTHFDKHKASHAKVSSNAPFAAAPFSEYRYYTFLHNKLQRYFVHLVHDKTKHRKTLARARYNMCVNLGTELTWDQTVDHIDNNKLNDSLENLQILSRADNIRKSSKPEQQFRFTCPVCNTDFYRSKRRAYLAIHCGKTICCSQHCGGIYRGR